MERYTWGGQHKNGGISEGVHYDAAVSASWMAFLKCAKSWMTAASFRRPFQSRAVHRKKDY